MGSINKNEGAAAIAVEKEKLEKVHKLKFGIGRRYPVGGSGCRAFWHTCARAAGKAQECRALADAFSGKSEFGLFPLNDFTRRVKNISRAFK